jgi:hypothetical protein
MSPLMSLDAVTVQVPLTGKAEPPDAEMPDGEMPDEKLPDAKGVNLTPRSEARAAAIWSKTVMGRTAVIDGLGCTLMCKNM